MQLTAVVAAAAAAAIDDAPFLVPANNGPVQQRVAEERRGSMAASCAQSCLVDPWCALDPNRPCLTFASFYPEERALTLG